MIAADKASDRKNWPEAVRLYTLEMKINPVNSSTFMGRGFAYAALHHYSKAIAGYTHVLELEPEQSSAYYLRACAHEQRGEFGQAIADYRQAISLIPTSRFGAVDAYNDLAWLLATCPQAKFRNGKQAVENAKGAWEVSMEKDSNVMDTMAAAYAEAGDFAQAVSWEQNFLATPGRSKNDVVEAKQRLSLYKAGKPFHEKV